MYILHSGHCLTQDRDKKKRIAITRFLRLSKRRDLENKVYVSCIPELIISHAKDWIRHVIFLKNHVECISSHHVLLLLLLYFAHICVHVYGKEEQLNKLFFVAISRGYKACWDSSRISYINSTVFFGTELEFVDAYFLLLLRMVNGRNRDQIKTRKYKKSRYSINRSR